MKNIKLIKKEYLINNLKLIKNCNKKICVMVKADAYGHNLKLIVNALKDSVCWFGVANEIEALNVRKYAHNANILVVGKSSNYSKLIKEEISFTVDTMTELQQVLKICNQIDKTAKIHIAVNTGMNRIGTNSINEFKLMVQFIENNPKLKLEGVFTHFFDADCKKNHFYQQMKKFYSFIKSVKQDVLFHVGGSYVLNYKLPAFIDMVRVGFFLYGYGNIRGLKPIMELKSKIIKIIHCKKGEYVGYGNKTKLTCDMTIAIVPVGYADGIPREMSCGGTIFVGGTGVKIVGNICMDMCMIDVTNTPCKVDDEVIICNDAVGMAKQLKTSPYEVLTNFQRFRGKSLII